LEGRWTQYNLTESIGRRRFNCQPSPGPLSPVLSFTLLLLLNSASAVAQTGPALPDAPRPQVSENSAQQTTKPPKATTEPPCKSRSEGSGIQDASKIGAAIPGSSNSLQNPKPEPCPSHVPIIDWYARFLNGPQVKPLTPREKALLAVRNLIDPFNAITIAGNSAIYVGADSHSAYGPGMAGFGKNVGISYVQDGTSEFFSTFLIPSIAHQDPHYHRMPEADVPRRIVHAIVQVGWTQGDNGRGMLNYANLIGFAIDGQLANLYVPGVQSNATATTSRYLIALGTAPADNFITEFLPDIARHIHFRVVIVQRIIDQVARTESSQ
jgi:hypothetical protein